MRSSAGRRYIVPVFPADTRRHGVFFSCSRCVVLLLPLSLQLSVFLLYSLLFVGFLRCTCFFSCFFLVFSSQSFLFFGSCLWFRFVLSFLFLCFWFSCFLFSCFLFLMFLVLMFLVLMFLGLVLFLFLLWFLCLLSVKRKLLLKYDLVDD